MSIDHKRHIESLLESHSKTTEILQLELQQLKQLNDHKDNEYSELQYEFRAANEKHRQ